MENLNWELSVLSRAVRFSNLSGASAQIGVSQPQLSRIISRLEETHHVNLLDRQTKRKSAWTAEAFKLAELYTKLVQQFKLEVKDIGKGSEPSILRVGCLDGLMDEGLALCKTAYSLLPVKIADLLVADLGELEESYFKGNLDILFTSREPGKRKLERSQIIGFQTLESTGAKSELHVLSSYEFASNPKVDSDKALYFVSNSLAARQKWIAEFGGCGTLPSAIYRKEKKSTSANIPVYLIGVDHLPDNYWSELLKAARSRA